MKANQKFRNGDEAVSPVIAVILMVAITVVLAATVYVWVSGFGSNSNQPAKSIAFTSGGTLVTGTDLDASADAGDSYKTYIVSAASPGLKWSDLTFTLNGATMTDSTGDCNNVLTDIATADGAYWQACTAAFAASGSTGKGGGDLVSAGDHLYVLVNGGSASGQTFRVLDSAANAIITTLTVS